MASDVTQGTCPLPAHLPNPNVTLGAASMGDRSGARPSHEILLFALNGPPKITFRFAVRAHTYSSELEHADSDHTLEKGKCHSK